MNQYHFLILGSEKRQMYLAELLREQGHVVMMAEEYQPGYHDAVLLPVAASGKYLRENACKLQKGQIIYGSRFPADIVEECDNRGIHFIDYMKVGDTARKNAVATAEGAIVEALKSGVVTLMGSQCMVLGYGKCGQVLVDRLLGLKSRVSVMARRSEQQTIAWTAGCDVILPASLKNEIVNYEYVFNTIPAMVLDSEILTKVKKDVTIIDIASNPGGVDYDFCRKQNINARLCPGLPGIYAPKSAARILLEVIEKTILGGE